MRFRRGEFPARVVRSTDLGDFVLTETLYGAGEALPLHSHDHGCLVVVLEGTFHETSDGRPRHGAPGMIIVRPEGEPHSNRFDGSGGRCLNVEIAPRWLTRMREGAPVFQRPEAFAGGAWVGAGGRLCHQLTRRAAVSAESVECHLLAFAVGGGDETLTSTPPPRWLVRVRDRIHADPAARLTLGELAAEAGVHPVHLASAFRRHFGLTLARYVRRLRVEYACRAIAGSKTPLAEIALDAGFSDQSHLGRTFRRAVGMTPAAYRGAAGPRA